MAESGQPSVRIETQRSMGWKQKGMLCGALGLSAALLADKIGLIDLPMPGIDVETEVNFEVGGVENPEIILTGNICPVTVEGEVDTSLTAKQNIQFGIGGYGPTKTLNIMDGRAHVEGAVEACTTGEDTQITLSKLVDTETQQTAYGMNITVGDVFAHGARVTNLAEPGAVECGMTKLYEFADLLDDIGEETMCGSLQELGAQAMEQAVCFPEAEAAFATGFKETILGIINQVMVELGERAIDPEHVSITITDEDFRTKTATPTKVATELIEDKNATMPDGVTFALESIECGQAVIAEEALEDEAVKVVPRKQHDATKVETAEGK